MCKKIYSLINITPSVSGFENICIKVLSIKKNNNSWVQGGRMKIEPRFLSQVV